MGDRQGFPERFIEIRLIVSVVRFGAITWCCAAGQHGG